jgi:pyocin large subunit-like protein
MIRFGAFWYWLMVKVFRPYQHTRGFANYARFIEHFDNRRSRFNLNTWREFAVWADTFCGGPMDAHTDHCTKSNGETLRFHNVSGLFAVIRTDNVIRTCFPPSKGRKYFEDECKK